MILLVDNIACLTMRVRLCFLSQYIYIFFFSYIRIYVYLYVHIIHCSLPTFAYEIVLLFNYSCTIMLLYFDLHVLFSDMILMPKVL